jgi:hypothetical protein
MVGVIQFSVEQLVEREMCLSDVNHIFYLTQVPPHPC